MKSAVIVDIDGTIATRTVRGPFEYDKVFTDDPKKDVIEVVVALWRAGHEIIFVSARDKSCWLETYKWLKWKAIVPPFKHLYMRTTGDVRDDAIVKREIYEEFIQPNYNVLCVLDDRQKVVDMWREIGLTCLQVDYGDF